MPHIYSFKYVEKLAKKGRKKARNPELLVVSENPERRRKKMAAKRKSPFRVKIGGRGMSYRSLVKKYGVRKAARLYKRKKYHRGRKVRVCRKRRRAANSRRRYRSRSRNSALRKKIGGRWRTHRALLKQYGVRKGNKLWKSQKCVSHNKKRRKRRSRRRSFRR